MRTFMTIIGSILSYSLPHHKVDKDKDHDHKENEIIHMIRIA